jgi:predicted ribosome-associated RNA-binding protein Tma20
MCPGVIERLSLSRDDRIFLQGELSQLVNSQISSIKSSMTGYEQYNNYTQVSLQIKYVQIGQNESGIQIDKAMEVRVPGEQNKSILNNSGLVILFVLIIGNIFLTLYLLNKIKKSQNFS